MADKIAAGQDPRCKLALERFNLAHDSDSDVRAKSLNDLEFSVGNQWTAGILDSRGRFDKPCLTMDQTQQSVRLVTNQYRQQPPAIQVNPIGNGADQEIADVIQGITRHVEVNCDAQVTY